MAGREYREVRFRFDGDQNAAKSLIGFGRTFLGMVKEQMAFQNLAQLTRRVKLASGAIVMASSAFGQDIIGIYHPPIGGPAGEATEPLKIKEPLEVVFATAPHGVYAIDINSLTPELIYERTLLFATTGRNHTAVDNDNGKVVAVFDDSRSSSGLSLVVLDAESYAVVETEFTISDGEFVTGVDFHNDWIYISTLYEFVIIEPLANNRVVHVIYYNDLLTAPEYWDVQGFTAYNWHSGTVRYDANQHSMIALALDIDGYVHLVSYSVDDLLADPTTAKPIANFATSPYVDYGGGDISFGYGRYNGANALVLANESSDNSIDNYFSIDADTMTLETTVQDDITEAPYYNASNPVVNETHYMVWRPTSAFGARLYIRDKSTLALVDSFEIDELTITNDGWERDGCALAETSGFAFGTLAGTAIFKESGGVFTYGLVTAHENGDVGFVGLSSYYMEEGGDEIQYGEVVTEE